MVLGRYNLMVWKCNSFEAIVAIYITARKKIFNLMWMVSIEFMELWQGKTIEIIIIMHVFTIYALEIVNDYEIIY